MRLFLGNNLRFLNWGTRPAIGGLRKDLDNPQMSSQMLESSVCGWVALFLPSKDVYLCEQRPKPPMY